QRRSVGKLMIQTMNRSSIRLCKEQVVHFYDLSHFVVEKLNDGGFIPEGEDVAADLIQSLQLSQFFFLIVADDAEIAKDRVRKEQCCGQKEKRQRSHPIIGKGHDYAEGNCGQFRQKSGNHASSQ